ncbi:MAG: hypothetical protein U1E73_11485 [Planctomycetota bacterium]
MRLSLLSASLLLAPAVLAQRFPEVEPNDSAATAQLVAIGTQIDSNLVAAEFDWYTFTVASYSRIRVHTSGLDTRIALADATGTSYFAIDDDSRTTTYGFASEIAINLLPGTYTVLVTGFTTSTAGAYTLDVATLPLTTYDAVEVEPNDTYSTATPTGALAAGGKKFHGTISPNTVVYSDSAAVPAAAPVVYSGVVSGPTTIATGTAIAGSTTTVTNVASLGQPMANPPLATNTPGLYLEMTSGANIGLKRLISSNTISSTTLIASITTAAFPVANSAGDTYQIVTDNSTTVTWVPSLPLASLYLTSAYNIKMTSGANVGVSKLISANTGPSAFGSEITSAAFTVANSPGDTFDIECIGSTSTFRVTTPLVPGQWNPTTGFTTTSTVGHYHIRFTSGANAGLYRQIMGNTGSSITLSSALTAVPAAGDTFDVEQADTDYWQVVLTAPYTGVWFQINEGEGSFIYGYRYEIYDGAGNALQPASSIYTSAMGTQSSTSSTLSPRTSTTRVWPAGTYYIAIRNAQTPFSASSAMPGALVPSGNYTLELYTAPMDVGGVVAETETTGGPNTNNTVATATPIAFGQVGQGNITLTSGGDSSDWWGPIVITSPTTVFYQTRRQGTATPLIDSTINLRDAAGAIALTSTTGNILDVPTTTTSGAHARAAVSFYIPGTYYIEVLSPGTTAGIMAGDYELELSLPLAAPYVAASYSLIATNTACGVSPFPTLTRTNTGEVPALGSTFSRQLTLCPPSAPFLLLQGLSNTTANGGSIPLPYDLTTLGAPSCTVDVDPASTSFAITDAAGTAELQTLLPNSLAFRGLYWFEQAFVLNPSANALGVQVSNYGRLLIGERTY